MARDPNAAWRRMRAGNAARKGAIGVAHVAKAQLGLDDTAYRALLRRVTGKESCGQMTLSELEAVLAEMRRLGFKKAAPKKAGRARLPDGPHAKKIRALWLDLHQASAVRNPAEAALDAWVKRQCGLDSLRFVDADQAQPLIEALKAWLERVGGEAIEA